MVSGKVITRRDGTAGNLHSHLFGFFLKPRRPQNSSKRATAQVCLKWCTITNFSKALTEQRSSSCVGSFCRVSPRSCSLSTGKTLGSCRSRLTPLLIKFCFLSQIGTYVYTSLYAKYQFVLFGKWFPVPQDREEHAGKHHSSALASFAPIPSHHYFPSRFLKGTDSKKSPITKIARLKFSLLMPLPFLCS